MLKENNIKAKNNRFYRQLPIDENYFQEIDTPNKAYVLGYIFADGCITKGKVLTLSSSEENKEVLEIIKKELKTECKIGSYIEDTPYISNYRYYKLSIVNQKIYDDLVKLGLQPKKSLINIFPKDLKQEFIKDFIRGYFDGNGSIYYTKEKKHGYIQPTISFTGAEEIIKEINKILNEVLNSSSKIYPYSKNDKIFDLKYGLRTKLDVIYEYFYKDALLFLGRKK